MKSEIQRNKHQKELRVLKVQEIKNRYQIGGINFTKAADKIDF